MFAYAIFRGMQKLRDKMDDIAKQLKSAKKDLKMAQSAKERSTSAKLKLKVCGFSEY